MSKQQLSTELQLQEDPDAVEIIKLQNIAVFFGNQTTHDRCEMRRTARQEKRLQADKQRMIRDMVKPIRVCDSKTQTAKLPR